MTLRLSAAFAALTFTLAACAPPPPATRSLSAASQTQLEGKSFTLITERQPDMRVVQQTGGAVAIGGGLTGLAAALIVTAAMNAIEAAATDVYALPVVDADLIGPAERLAAARFAELTGAAPGEAPAVVDAGSTFTATPEGAALAAKSRTAADLLLNVRLEDHSLSSSGSGENETFLYAVVMTGALVDANTGALLGRADCKGGNGLGAFEDFKLESLRHAGGDAAAASARLAAYESEVAAAKERANDPGLNPDQRDPGAAQRIPNPAVGFTTEAEDKAYLTFKAREATEACANILVEKLLNRRS